MDSQDMQMNALAEQLEALQRSSLAASESFLLEHSSLRSDQAKISSTCEELKLAHHSSVEYLAKLIQGITLPHHSPVLPSTNPAATTLPHSSTPLHTAAATSIPYHTPPAPANPLNLPPSHFHSLHRDPPNFHYTHHPSPSIPLNPPPFPQYHTSQPHPHAVPLTQHHPSFTPPLYTTHSHSHASTSKGKDPVQLQDPYPTNRGLLPTPFHRDDPDPYLSNKPFYHKPSPRYKLPICEGDDCRSWTSKCRKYFHIYEIPPENQVEVASLFLQGKAEDWFTNWSRDRDILIWDEFSEALETRFQVLGELDAVEEIQTLRQTSYVEAYLSKFETLRIRMERDHPNHRESYYIIFSGRPEGRYQNCCKDVQPTNHC